jgi:hypothetical protein
MKLEYLHADSSHPKFRPLIRLYDFTIEEACQLRDSIHQLAAGSNQRVELHNMPWVESIGNCRLTLFLQRWDQAVVRKKGKDENDFECGFPVESWDNIEGLLEPYSKGTKGFQRLAGPPGEADIIISWDGKW